MKFDVNFVLIDHGIQVLYKILMLYILVIHAQYVNRENIVIQDEKVKQSTL